ncbi:class I SAM-dependent methyltransferase [Anaerovibrio sp.]|uniref:class I SAM-dependent methyltransferase n=1 Tax=Anaerovibrio sp. TaxID=1872532 RepID=UPI0025C158C6|nr:class I SAM-dependent methyltransferase [Anaerovibrio sp.]
MLDFSQLDINPESFEIDVLRHIPESVLKHSEMHEVERRFVNGLIRLVKPRNIIEIGVSGGAGSAVILNAISDMPESHLYSFDIADKWYMDTSKDVGWVTDLMWPDDNKQWSLYTGKDVSAYVDQLNCKFDFAIIDTAHVHPVESLNFISVLPYLNDNAVVIFHDLALFTRFSKFDKFPGMSLANKLAYDTIVGKKIEPGGKEYLDFNLGIPSIGAVQISSDTRKYVDNIFNMLFFPWAGFFVADYIFDVADVVRKKYSSKLLQKFCDAVSLNARLHYNEMEYSLYNEKAMNDILLAKEMIFYGAGKICTSLLKFIQQNDCRNPDLILDKDVSKHNLFGVPIKEPDFDGIDFAQTVFIVTIKDKDTVQEVKDSIKSKNIDANIYDYKELYLAIIYDKLSKIMKK